MRTSVSFSRTMMQVLDMLQLGSWDEVTLISEEIKPVAMALSSYTGLKALISHAVSQ